MATDINQMTSAVASPVVLRDASGREATRTLAVSANSSADQLHAEDINVKSLTTEASAETTRTETKAEGNSNHAELEKQVQDLHETAVLKGWSVNFSVDKDLDRTVVKVVDSKTKEIIRQIPSEEWLDTAKRLKEFSELNDKKLQQLEPGMLFDKEV
ncbi:flagellar protein FlaG [uncultured Tolumonas sp.]|uniref:flagellar protein FlaG n=1 Tax=uncultured Tolumonas sp. TaxID=263765 RepID=UPI002931D953|nr:flagellar protein FlaG [uncultured Tolumonas sp.]